MKWIETKVFTSEEIMNFFNLISENFSVKHIKISNRGLLFYLGSYYDQDISLVIKKYLSGDINVPIGYGIYVNFCSEINEIYPLWKESPDEDFICRYDKSIRKWIKNNKPRESVIWKFINNY